METWVLILTLYYGVSDPLTNVPGYASQMECAKAADAVRILAEAHGSNSHYPTAFCIPGPRTFR